MINHFGSSLHDDGKSGCASFLPHPLCPAANVLNSKPFSHQLEKITKKMKVKIKWQGVYPHP